MDDGFPRLLKQTIIKVRILFLYIVTERLARFRGGIAEPLVIVIAARTAAGFAGTTAGIFTCRGCQATHAINRIFINVLLAIQTLVGMCRAAIRVAGRSDVIAAA